MSILSLANSSYIPVIVSPDFVFTAEPLPGFTGKDTIDIRNQEKSTNVGKVLLYSVED